MSLTFYIFDKITKQFLNSTEDNLKIHENTEHLRTARRLKCSNHLCSVDGDSCISHQHCWYTTDIPRNNVPTECGDHIQILYTYKT